MPFLTCLRGVNSEARGCDGLGLLSLASGGIFIFYLFGGPA